MMDSNIAEIFNRTIRECQQKLSPSACILLTTLQEFENVIRLKAEDNAHEPNTNVKTKLRAAQHQEEKQRQKLDKLRTDFQAEKEFKHKIVAQNCALIMQQQQSHQKLMSKEKDIAEYKIASKQKELQRKQEEVYEIQISQLRYQLEGARTKNLQKENEERNCWNNRKEELKDLQLKYDTQMLAQDEELEILQNLSDREAIELQHYKEAYANQEEPYCELMKEKEEYLEEKRQQKLYEIRLKIAKRTIVKFVEDHYPAWKKKKLKASKKKGKYKFNLNKKN